MPGSGNGHKKVAIVLSGGAARGDFEVGALSYLVWRAGVKPAIVCGTSVGAINAAKVAEGGNESDSGSRGLSGLVEIWQALKANTDMWEYEHWFEQANAEVKAATDNPIGFFAAMLFGGAGTVMATAAAAASARSIANLGPIAKVLRDPKRFDLGKVRSSGIELRIATVALGDGQLRVVNQHGEVFERDGTRTMTEDTDPACAAPIRKKLDDLGKQRAAAIVSAHGQESGVDRELYEEKAAGLELELKKCLAANANVPLKVDLRDAVLASSSLPFFFPPVKLGNDWYVDGGVRAVEPVELAVKAGADMVYGVVAAKLQMPQGRTAVSGDLVPDYEPSNANLLDIGIRVSGGIMPDENCDRDLAPPRGWGIPVVLIEPQQNVHDAMTIDPGLIDIRMSDGFMTADDTVQAYARNPGDYRRVADEFSKSRMTAAITSQRHEIWKREFAALGCIINIQANGTVGTAIRDPLPNEAAWDEALAEVRVMKTALKAMVQQRHDAHGKLPIDAADWSTKFERHHTIGGRRNVTL
jgi:NTE family protein